MSIFRSALLGLYVLIASLNSHAITPLFDGDFESGTLQGWNPSAGAVVATRGTCFSGGDTTQIRVRGQYAGMLRSNENALGSFTSKPFVAGTGITFLSLSELIGKQQAVNPFALNVSILDGAANILSTQPLATAMLALSEGCPSSKRDHSFSTHFISTREHQGKQIKVRFTHHAELAKTGAFTLIDTVGIVNSKVPLFHSSPKARAGIAQNSGVVSLVAGLPNGELSQTNGWQYSWFIDGETSERPFYNPCVNDLAAGEYTSTLYVNDNANNRLVTDTFNFIVPDSVDSDVDVSASDDSEAETLETTLNPIAITTSATVTDLTEVSRCDTTHPTDLVEAPIEPGDSESIPTIDTLITNTPFTADTASSIFSSVALTSSTTDNLSKAVIELDNTQLGDELLALADNGTNGLSKSSCSSTGCTYSGTSSTSSYETVLDSLQIELADTASVRTITLTIYDSNNASSISTTVNISTERDAPTIDNLDTNSPFTANTASLLFSGVELRSNTSSILSKAVIELMRN
jgi:hypothetical protein